MSHYLTVPANRQETPSVRKVCFEPGLLKKMCSFSCCVAFERCHLKLQWSLVTGWNGKWTSLTVISQYIRLSPTMTVRAPKVGLLSRIQVIPANHHRGQVRGAGRYPGATASLVQTQTTCRRSSWSCHASLVTPVQTSDALIMKPVYDHLCHHSYLDCRLRFVTV